MGSNRGWWNLPESTDSEREAKYNWQVSKVIDGIIPNGLPHLQRWKYNAKTKEVERIGSEKPLSKYMWKKYGPAIIKAEPNFKFGK